MKKLYLLFFLLFVKLFISAQIKVQKITSHSKEISLINMNPDPYGEPWIAGGCPPATQKVLNDIKETPKLKLPKGYKSNALPYKLDNSTLKFFRPIFNQVGGSCGQASGIAYTYTYELNFLRDSSSNISENQYPSHYTWNFINGGEGYGSWYYQGWDIIKSNGCPNVNDFGGVSGESNTYWMSGFDKYKRGMNNQILEYFTIIPGEEEGLETLKQWFNDHLDGSTYGGLANFAVDINNYLLRSLPTSTEEAGKKVVTRWGSGGGHAMTFVGYNDSIRYDVNGDGQYTNDIDITDDGIVDMQDWEIGGLIIANSWGTSWGDSGKAYMLYRLLALPYSQGGLQVPEVHVVRAKELYEPLLMSKIEIEHSRRNLIKLGIGVSTNKTADKPDFIKEFNCFKYQGGDLPMNGSTNVPIEISLDITELLNYIEPGTETKFFLCAHESDMRSQGKGKIISFSIVDLSNGEDETASLQTNVTIENNTTTYISVNKAIDFDKIEITSSDPLIAIASTPYSYQLTANGGTLPYKWKNEILYEMEDISESFPDITSQKLDFDDDKEGIALISLDFPFFFYGKTYDTIYISTNGSILFNDYSKNILPDISLKCPLAIIPFGCNMVLSEEGEGAWYSGNADSATIRWKTNTLFYELTVTIDVAVTLYPNGDMKFYYQELSDNIDVIIGISDGDGASFTNPYNQSASIPADYQFKLSAKYPIGLSLSENGLLQGTVETSNETWLMKFKATDYSNISTSKYFAFTTGTIQEPIADFEANNTSALIEETISFKDMSENIATSWIWIFNGGNPDTSTLRNPSVTYDSLGTYSVKLIATNSAGSDTIIKEDYLTVTLPPLIPDFSANKTATCFSEEVTFRNLTSGIPSSFEWTFENGTPSSSIDENPVVTFNTEGKHNVTLIATDLNGSVTETKEDYIIIKDREISVPITENFEGNFLPEDWGIVNLDNKVTWKKTTVTGYESTSCIVINNSENENTGEIDKIITANYDLSSLTDPKLRFYVAYTRVNYSKRDILKIFASTNCGKNWGTPLYEKDHNSLETYFLASSYKSRNWIPSESDHWRMETIYLSSFSSESSVSFKIQNVSGCGAKIWIDDFSISENAVLSIEENIIDLARLSPNPTNGSVKLELISLKESDYIIEIRDVLGRLVYRDEINNCVGQITKNIDMSSNSKGVYLLNIRNTEHNQTLKLLLN